MPRFEDVTHTIPANNNRIREHAQQLIDSLAINEAITKHIADNNYTKGAAETFVRYVIANIK